MIEFAGMHAGQRMECCSEVGAVGELGAVLFVVFFIGGMCVAGKIMSWMLNRDWERLKGKGDKS